MKNKNLFLSFLLILGIFITSPTSGQKENNRNGQKKIEHSIGVAFGFTTGYGLAYRLKINTIGFRTNFAPYIDQYKNIYNIGLTLTKDLITNEKTKFLIYFSNSYNYENFHSVAVPSRELNKYLNTGIGIGIEFILLEKIEFDIMAGYGVYRRTDEVNMTAEAGFFYKF
ncbi:MAG: hypothetical protein AMS27_14850 [Bacteroides sp. SM23_62_1]|nr:MAG: hypothetical protein AMS27_14850 [Bacteroides sp. SM23_62_1]